MYKECANECASFSYTILRFTAIKIHFMQGYKSKQLPTSPLIKLTSAIMRMRSLSKSLVMRLGLARRVTSLVGDLPVRSPADRSASSEATASEASLSMLARLLDLVILAVANYGWLVNSYVRYHINRFSALRYTRKAVMPMPFKTLLNV